MGEKVIPNLEQPEESTASQADESMPVNEWGGAPLTAWPPVEKISAEE